MLTLPAEDKISARHMYLCSKRWLGYWTKCIYIYFYIYLSLQGISMKITRMDYVNWVLLNMHDHNFLMRYHFEIRSGFNDN